MGVGPRYLTARHQRTMMCYWPLTGTCMSARGGGLRRRRRRRRSGGRGGSIQLTSGRRVSPSRIELQLALARVNSKALEPEPDRVRSLSSFQFWCPLALLLIALLPLLIGLMKSDTQVELIVLLSHRISSCISASCPYTRRHQAWLSSSPLPSSAAAEQAAVLLPCFICCSRLLSCSLYHAASCSFLLFCLLFCSQGTPQSIAPGPAHRPAFEGAYNLRRTASTQTKPYTQRSGMLDSSGGCVNGAGGGGMGEEGREGGQERATGGGQAGRQACSTDNERTDRSYKGQQPSSQVDVARGTTSVQHHQLV